MRRNGFTIIESVVAMAVFLIIIGALFGLTQLILENIGQARVRHTARLLANEKAEEAKNLSYDSLGTQGGIPQGPIPQTQTVSLGGIGFTIKTAIIYIDDPFDQTAPQDTLNTDYKRIRIEVSWMGSFSSGKRPVVLVSDIAPAGIESQAGGGTLSILVFNAQGEPIPNAQVAITNTFIEPNIDILASTDAFGRIILPGSPISIEGYNIQVTREGYSTDKTYTNEEVANPLKPYLSVLEGEVTQMSFTIDKLSSLTIKSFGTKSAGFPALGNLSFQLQGEKIIGTDVFENPVYKYSQEQATGQSGNLTLNNIEFDNYSINITDPSFDLAGSAPALPLSILPDTEVALDLSLAPNSANSLLVLVRDAQENPLSSASARLVNQLIEYDETITTGNLNDPDFGHAFFPSLFPLQYQLTVDLTGYEQATSSAQIDEDNFTQIFLNPI